MSNGNGTIEYQLGTPDELSRLLDDLPSISERIVVVGFSGDTPTFPTDLQLARLVGAGWDNTKQLVIKSHDAALAERALKLGFVDSAVDSDAPDVSFADTRSIPPVIVARADDPEDERQFDTTASLATYRPEPAMAAAASESVYQHSFGGSGAFHRVEANWTSRPDAANTSMPGSFASAEAPTAHIDAASVAQGAEPDEGSYEDPAQDAERHSHRQSSKRPRSRPRRRAILASAIVAPVLVLGVVAALAVFLLPTADVSVIPTEEEVSSSMTYGVAIGDVDYDVTIDPTTTSNTITAEATQAASGERFEPDGTAAGVIQVTNPLTSNVTVPAGTEIAGGNGVTYYTSEDLEIEAADPFGSMSFGSGTVGIYAGIAGPDANLDAGTLTGQFGSGLFYTNPEPISGGTMRAIPVIEEGDVQAVASQVEQDLRDRAEQEFRTSIPSDHEIVPGTIEVGDPEIDVEGEAGQDGESVSASGSITASAQIYNPEEMHQVAGEEADRLLTREGRSDQILRAETVQMREPEAINGDGTAFRIDVEATARTVLDEAERDQIVEDMVGLSLGDAQARLDEHPKIRDYSITIEPDWLPDRMPEILSRIDLSVNSGEQTTATR